MAKTVKELQDEMAANSAAWWDATTKDEKEDLHALNVGLQAQIDALTNGKSHYDEDSGVWTSTPGNVNLGDTSGGSSGGGRAAYYNDDPNYDYSEVLAGLMNAGSTDASRLQRLLDERTAKASSVSGLGQYADDAFAQSVRDYIAGLNQPVPQQQPQQQQQNNANRNQYMSQLQASLGNQYVPSAQNDAERERLLSALEAILANIGEAPTYEPGWGEETYLREAQRAVDMSYDDFVNSDAYRALAARYDQQGRQSMQNILGQLAARTGGLASSYASTAAQQGYNDYMSQLEAAARNLYANERNEAIENAGIGQGYGNMQYGRYLDALNQRNADVSLQRALLGDLLGYNYRDDENAYARYANDRNYNADIINQLLGYDYRDDETAYNRGIDQRNFDLELYELLRNYVDRDDERAYQRMRDEQNYELNAEGTAYDRGQTARKEARDSIYYILAKTGGRIEDLDEDQIRASGLTTAEMNAYMNEYRMNNQPRAVGGSRGSGSGSGAGQNGDGSDTGEGAEDGSDWKISNFHTDTSIYIPGHGYFSYGDLKIQMAGSDPNIIQHEDAATKTLTYTWKDDKSYRNNPN